MSKIKKGTGSAFQARSVKSLDCKNCGETVHNVGSDSTAVICWRCVSRGLRSSALSDDKIKKSKT